MTTRFTLPGGTLVLVEPSPILPLVSFTIAARSGALADPPGEEGLTRLTTRMLRRGCRGLSANDIETAIDTMGAELSAEVSYSNAQLHGQCITRSARTFAELLGKLLGAPTFPEEELARLVRETQAEIVQSRDDDRGLCERAYRAAVFPGHPYGRSVRGTRASVEVAGERPKVKSLYARLFTRESTIIGLAGDVTEEKARALAEIIARDLPEGRPREDELPETALPKKRRLVFVDKPERTQTQILIGTTGTHPRDPDHVPLSVANAVFGGTFTARLMKEVRSKRGWSYGASSRLGVDRRRHPMTLWTFPAQTDAPACIALEIELLEKLVDDGITDKELRFIQKYLARSWAFEIDTAQKRLHQALDVELLDLPADYHREWVARVLATTTESCNAALRARVDPASLLVCVVGTAKEALDEVADAIPGLAERAVLPFDRD